MGLKEGEVIQHSMVTASIERAQKKVEENNFGIRKRLLEYDDVMNKQRQVIYRRRHNALFGERLKLDVLNMFHDVATVWSRIPSRWRLRGLPAGTVPQVFGRARWTRQAFKNMKPGRTHGCRLLSRPWTAYPRRGATNGGRPCRDHRRLPQPGAQYENIVVPITDGMKTMQVVDQPAEGSYKSEGRDLITASRSTSHWPSSTTSGRSTCAKWTICAAACRTRASSRRTRCSSTSWNPSSCSMR
jgi:preprotein translocase subunit SecA